MCSRYFLDADGNVIAYTFRVAPDAHLRKRFNIAPTQDAPVVRLAESGKREIALLRWGLVPSWAKDLAVGTKMINARSEGVHEKPAFREAIKRRRCLVPASGFFEWQPVGKRKQPFAITVADRPLFAFAGLWESWRAADRSVETFTIVTTDANATVGQVHDRMPVILPRDAEDAWLAAEPEAARALLKPYEGAMNLRAVGPRVGDPKADVPECLDDDPSWGAQRSLL